MFLYFTQALLSQNLLLNHTCPISHPIFFHPFIVTTPPQAATEHHAHNSIFYFFMIQAANTFISHSIYIKKNSKIALVLCSLGLRLHFHIHASQNVGSIKCHPVSFSPMVTILPLITLPCASCTCLTWSYLWFGEQSDTTCQVHHTDDPYGYQRWMKLFFLIPLSFSQRLVRWENNETIK